MCRLTAWSMLMVVGALILAQELSARPQDLSSGEWQPIVPGPIQSQPSQQPLIDQQFSRYRLTSDLSNARPELAQHQRPARQTFYNTNTKFSTSTYPTYSNHRQSGRVLNLFTAPEIAFTDRESHYVTPSINARNLKTSDNTVWNLVSTYARKMIPNRKKTGTKKNSVVSHGKISKVTPKPSSKDNAHDNSPWSSWSSTPAPIIILQDDYTPYPPHNDGSFTGTSYYKYPTTSNPSVQSKPLPLVVKPEFSSHQSPTGPGVISSLSIDTGNYYMNPVVSNFPLKEGEKCPTVYITAQTSLNETKAGKEGCSDVSIVINSAVHNHNFVASDETNALAAPLDAPAIPTGAAAVPGAPPNAQLDTIPDILDAPVAQAPASPAASGGGGGPGGGLPSLSSLTRPPQLLSNLLNSGDNEDDEDDSLITTIVDSFTNPLSWLEALNPLRYPIMNVIFGPFSLILAGGLSLLLFLFPLAFPSFLLARSSRKIPEYDATYHYHQPVYSNGWYWHEGYKTWINSPRYHKSADNSGYYRYGMTGGRKKKK